MKNPSLTDLISSLSAEEYCYLTTTGRVTGKPHEIEIWFVIHDITLHLMAGGKYESDWVKNLVKNPSVTVRIAKHIFAGMARIVTDEKEEMTARTTMAEKYQEWEEGRTLSQWARTALPVAIDLDSLENK
jgi:deazaflavin-dependent oxidoreductase (nitroreductase family)